MVGAVGIDQFLCRANLLPQLDTFNLAFFLDTEEVPKDATTRSGLVLAFDEPRLLIATPLFQGLPPGIVFGVEMSQAIT
jgi:hypothetical protein